MGDKGERGTMGGYSHVSHSSTTPDVPLTTLVLSPEQILEGLGRAAADTNNLVRQYLS